MKLSSVMLAGSLAANVALLAALVLSPADSPPASLGSAVENFATASSTRAAESATATTTSLSGSTKPGAKLGTDDLGPTVARLRAAGFPPNILRALINQRFELRRQALSYDEISGPYWKNRPRTAADAQTAAALAQLDRERSDTMKQLLGTDDSALGDSDAARADRIARYGNLPAEKVAQLTSIQRDSMEQFSRLNGQSGGGPPLSDDEKVAAMDKATLMEKEMHASIAKLLTPDELLEYDLRNSPASERLRQALTGFNATEAEYRALFPLYQAVDEKFSGMPFALALMGQSDDQRAAEEQMREQIKALLGPERYADYQQASQPQYQQLNALVARLDLPLSAAAQVASVQQDVQQRVAAVRADRKLSADARTAQLVALAQEAATKITATLGARGLEGYKQNGGQWLNQLTPRPKAPASK